MVRRPLERHEPLASAYTQHRLILELTHERARRFLDTVGRVAVGATINRGHGIGGMWSYDQPDVIPQGVDHIPGAMRPEIYAPAIPTVCSKEWCAKVRHTTFPPLHSSTVVEADSDSPRRGADRGSVSFTADTRAHGHLSAGYAGQWRHAATLAARLQQT